MNVTNGTRISMGPYIHQSSYSHTALSSSHDMIILGILSQSFYLFGFVTVMLLNMSDSGETNLSSDLPIIMSCILFISTYLIGYFAEPDFSFSGWCYLFICTIIGVVHVFMLCVRNDVNRGKGNLITMLLVFSNLISITTKFNESKGTCVGTMTFALLVSFVPMSLSFALLRNDISSFDSSTKVNRWRLILYIFLWQTRLVITWNSPDCGGGLASDSIAFWNIIIDVISLSLTCDIFWN